MKVTDIHQKYDGEPPDRILLWEALNRIQSIEADLEDVKVALEKILRPEEFRPEN
jgi:hypothetical protein